MTIDFGDPPGKFIVLNVDHDDAGRKATSRALRQEGYVVLEAASGEEALRVAQEERPDGVVMRVELPDGDGFALCRRLKSDARTASIPVLQKSGKYTDSGSYVRGLESGADAYLMEPVETRAVLATVRSLLRTAQAQAEWRRARDELEARVAERTAALEAEVRERRQAEEKAQRQAAHAEALARAAAHLGQQLDLPAVLEAIYTYTARALDVPVVTISLYNAEQAQFEPAFAVGLPPGVFESLEPVAYKLTHQPKDDISAPIITRDVQELVDFPNAGFYRQLDVRTTVNVNLLRNGELVGRLNIGTIGERREFTEREMMLLAGFANQAALALNNARLYEEVKAGREQLAELSRRLAQAEEEERKRLSQELHDSAGQLATALQINLALVKGALADAEARQQLGEVEVLATQLHDEIRHVAQSLRPPRLEELGLNGALDMLCRQFRETMQLPVRFEGETLPGISDVVCITLYRIVQEALTNVARHAGECEAQVTLRGDDGRIQLTVEDDGAGFDVAKMSASRTGMGLQGMRERVQLLNGRVEIESQPGEGTRVVVRCPVETAQ